MKKINWIYFGALLICSVFQACEDDNITERKTSPDVKAFLNDVNLNPVVIDDIILGDSWRLIREEASYFDDDHRKEYTYNYLSDPEFSDYKQYWTFGQDKVLMSFDGNWAEKNWDGYYEIFNQSIDFENKVLTIDYVYEDGLKRSSVDWKVTSLTATELILTAEDLEEDSFFQMTFRREDF